MFKNQIVKAVSVVCAVSDHFPGGQVADKIASRSHIVLLAGTEHEAHWQSEGVYNGMNLGAKAAARAAESLGFRAPLLCRAPAA